MNSIIIAQNILKRAFRNKKELLALLLLPIIAIGIMSFLVDQSKQNEIPVGLVVLDEGNFAKNLASYIQGQAGFDIQSLKNSNYQDAVDQGKVELTIVIPKGFSTDISEGQKAAISIYFKKKTASVETIKQLLNQHINTLYSVNAVAKDLEGKTNKDPNTILNHLLSKVNNSPLSYQYRFAAAKEEHEGFQALTSSIGFTIVFIMVLIFSTMGTILEDKKKLTLARMFVSPAKEWEIIMGNLLGSLTLGLIQLIPLLFVLQGIFNIPMGVELLYIFLILFCFLIATIGLGIGLSGIIKNNFNPTLVIATVIVPTSILGGCFIPESMLPDFMNKLGYAVPQKWVMDAIEKVMANSGFSNIALNLGIILMFGLTFSTFGLKVLRPLQK